MAITNKGKFKQFVTSTEKHIEKVDTPAELREFTNYVFMMKVAERLAMSIDPNVASLAAARMHVSLPEGAHKKYPKQFDRLVELYGKHLHVLYHTLIEDYHSDVVEMIFLSLAEKVVVAFDF